MQIKKIKNNDTIFRTWHGQGINPGEYYQIQPPEEVQFANDSQLLIDIGSGKAIVNNGEADFTDVNDAVTYLKSLVPDLIRISDSTNKTVISSVGTSGRLKVDARPSGGTDGSEIGNVGDRLKSQNLPAAHAPNLTTTGSLTALNSVVSTSVLDGFGTAGIIVTGTWVGTITFEGSIDGTNWVSMTAQPLNGGILASTTTINASVRLNITGLQAIRAKMTAYTSGTANITIECTAEAGFIRALAGLTGGTDGTQIGNIGDALKTTTTFTGTVTSLAVACNVIKQNEIAVAVKVETDLPNSSYTVPTGKSFSMVSVGGSFDAQQPMYLRLKKQTAGAGAFVTIFRATLSVNGQDASNYSITVPNGVAIGIAGDVFKLTYEPAVGRGTLWAGYFGVEY